MYNSLTKCLEKPNILRIFAAIRLLSSTEISTALRPFYFSVHPDLFGKYPDQRTTNENSLKQLSSFIETAQSHKPFQPCTLHFYLRESKSDNGKFRLVKIPLLERNVRSTIITILRACNLPTEYLESVASTPKYEKRHQTYAYENEFDIYTIVNIKKKIDEVKEALNLSEWLKQNYKGALDKYKANEPLRKDIEVMCDDIRKDLDVKEVKWDCGWNEMHVRGCLQSFKALSKEHPDKMEVLKEENKLNSVFLPDRILVFAAHTGVSLDGHIMLNSGEVRHNWLDLIKNVRKHDKALLKIPNFEKAVSQVLRDIQVVRRKFMPKILAAEYKRHLMRLMTNLSDYHGYRGFPENLPLSLKNHQLVVESEAGPLMVSPTGQFIVPSSYPGGLLVSFITDNIEIASKKIFEYNAHKHIEKHLQAQCITELELASLRKDDNVTPESMITCCESFLANKSKLLLLKGLNVTITTYYSVLSDGTVCVPWNFKF